MATLTKDSRGRSPYWTACYTTADGRRLKKSTKERDKKKAQAIANAWEEAEDLARSGNLTELQFRRVLASTLERVTGKKFFDPTVREWLARWLANEEGTIERGTRKKYHQTVRLFLEHLGRRADHRLESVSSADVTSFRDALFAEGRAPSTANSIALTVLNTPFAIAQKQGLIQLNPVAGVKSLKDSKPEKGRFTLEQIQALVDTAQGDLKGWTLLGFYTGGRMSDLARLTWANIGLNEKIVTFRQKKTGRIVRIPLHTEAQEYLLSLPAPDSAEAPVFPTLFDRPSGSHTGLSETFKKLMAKAGVAAGVGRVRNEGLGRSTSLLSYHSLRHSFTSILANSGVPVDVRMMLTGHQSADMATHYSHTQLETVRAAVELVPRLRQKI